MRLKHLHGHSVGEIAEQMGKTPAAVAGLLRRGRDALRRRPGGPV
jgi:DNA-directed RNA polymerase specialized sigma24 family protein